MGKPVVSISRIVFIDLYNQGKSGLEIARFFGIGRTTVDRYYKRYGLEPRTIAEVRRNKFWNGGDSQRKIASELGKSQVGDKNPAWKGGFWKKIGMERSEYDAVHIWIKKQLGLPHKCQHCGATGLSGHKIHWANKSGKYLWETDDWLRLCVSCHKKHDKNLTYG